MEKEPNDPINKTYKEALNKWGYDMQETILMEECAELIKACSKRKRFNDPTDLMEELADVQIMIDQIKLHYESIGHKPTFFKLYTDKLIRLSERINSEESRFT